MSQTLEAPDLHRWLARLSPAQEQHLRTIIRSDDELPDVVDIADDLDDDPCGPVDESVPDEFLKLIGSITDALVQIDTKGYADVYQGTDREVRKVGIAVIGRGTVRVRWV